MTETIIVAEHFFCKDCKSPVMYLLSENEKDEIYDYHYCSNRKCKNHNIEDRKTYLPDWIIDDLFLFAEDEE